jgi:hypothetical protein
MRIPKVEVVGYAERRGAAARQVSSRFGNRDLSPFVRIELDIRRVTIDRQSDVFLARDAFHRVLTSVPSCE